MADYIDRQAAIAALRKFAESCKGSTEAATAAVMAISVISRLPGPWANVKDSVWDGGGEMSYNEALRIVRDYISAFDRMVKERKRRGLKTDWETGTDVFNWWMEYDVLPGQIGMEEIV